MRCKEAQRRWHQRLDEGTPDDQLDKHLAMCASCRDYAARMSQFVESLESLGRETEIVVATSSEILAFKPTTSSVARLWSLRNSGLLRIAAAIIIVALASFWFLPHGSRPIEVASRSVSENPTVTHLSSYEGGIVLEGESRNRFLTVAVQTGDDRVRAYRLYRQP